jgi:hypothetical protein
MRASLVGGFGAGVPGDSCLDLGTHRRILASIRVEGVEDGAVAGVAATGTPVVLPSIHVEDAKFNATSVACVAGVAATGATRE